MALAAGPDWPAIRRRDLLGGLIHEYEARGVGVTRVFVVTSVFDGDCCLQLGSHHDLYVSPERCDVRAFAGIWLSSNENSQSVATLHSTITLRLSVCG
jgi:hypothetical protein